MVNGVLFRNIAACFGNYIGVGLRARPRPAVKIVFLGGCGGVEARDDHEKFRNIMRDIMRRVHSQHKT